MNKTGDRNNLRNLTAELEGISDLFYVFAEQFPGGVFIKDAQSRIHYINPYIAKVMGADNWLTRTADQYLDKKYAEPLLESDKLALENGLSDQEIQIPDKNGELKLWRTIRFPLERPGKDPLIGVLALDITDQRAVEHKLSEQQSLYRSVVDNFPSGFVVLFDHDQRFMLVRGKGLELIGRKPEEYEGKTLYDIFPPETAHIVEYHHKTALNGKTSSFEIEVRGNAYDSTAVPVKDSEGNVIAGMAIVQIVSDRYRTRSFLHRRQQEYKALVENAQDIIARFDSSYRLLYVNPAFERITSLPSSWFRNMKVDELHLPANTAREFLEALNKVFETGEPAGIELQYAPKSGPKTFQVRLTPEFDPEGNVETVLGVGRDISGYKKLERDLRRAKDEAEAASLAKSEFLANMSHEIRTPMNAMLGYMDLISPESLEPAESEYLRIVKDSAETLLTIINDILDYSKIEAGKIELEAKAFNPRSVLETVIREHAVLADQKDLELTFECRDDLPAAVLGDISRLKQILRNLISNALKFTEEGSVRVRVERESTPAPPGKVRLRFSVIDTGIGLSEELKDKLFESFTQLESGMRKKYKGTGLGLAICKKLAGLLGGNIWVDSEPGKGCTFSFTALFDETAHLPESELTEKAYENRKKSNSELPDLKILLAEDNEVNRTFLTDLLLDHGHTINTAENGEEVLTKLANNEYDIVLMDVQMPVMDGMEATRSIRSGEYEGVDPNTPIIGLSAYAMSEHRTRFIKAGMNAFVSKPVNFEKLFKTISEVLDNTEVPAPAPDPEPVKPKTFFEHDADDNHELLDVAGITEHYSNKVAMYSRLCTMFFESARDNMDKIEQAAKTDDLISIEKLAHAIRGSSASMGAKMLANVSADLEDAASERNHEAVMKELERLEEILEPTLAKMAELRDRFRN